MQYFEDQEAMRHLVQIEQRWPNRLWASVLGTLGCSRSAMHSGAFKECRPCTPCQDRGRDGRRAPKKLPRPLPTAPPAPVGEGETALKQRVDNFAGYIGICTLVTSHLLATPMDL